MMCRMHMMKLPPVEISDEVASCKLNLVVQLYREYVHSFLNEQLTVDGTIFTVAGWCYKPTIQTFFLYHLIRMFKRTDYTDVFVPWVDIIVKPIVQTVINCLAFL